MGQAESTKSRKYCQSGWTMFAVGLLIRLAWIFVAHTYRFKTAQDNFGFGFEMGRIGRSLALGEGFGNPFDGITGPTAWEPPAYPFVIAGVFKLFGLYSRTSAIVLLSISSIFSALTCVPIVAIARRCFDSRVALWSGWAWAVLPPIIFWCTRWVWETSLAALILALIFWLTLCIEELDGFVPWVSCGMLWGIATLVNTSLLAFLPAAGLWACFRRAKLRKKFLIQALVSAVIFAACVSPWIVRNKVTLGKFIFIRSNFGAELRFGNGPGANGTWMDSEHPSKNVQQLGLYKQEGEVAYVAGRKREAVDFIEADYGRFGWLSLKRFAYYWTGLPQPDKTLAQTLLKNSWLFLTSLLSFCGLWFAFKRHIPAARLFVWLIILYPAVYYITFPHPRYRHPIEPELAILVVYGIAEIASYHRPTPAN